MTDYESKRSKALQDKYDIASVPTIIFIGNRGQEISKARITGFVEPEVFLDKITAIE